MNYSDITIGIVTYKSESVIFNCLKSIKKIKKIIIFDNSNDSNLKYIVKKKYPNIRFELSKQNLGYGAGNNSILKLSSTPYVLISQGQVASHYVGKNDKLVGLADTRERYRDTPKKIAEVAGVEHVAGWLEYWEHVIFDEISDQTLDK